MVERRRALADTSFFVGLETERLSEQTVAEFDLGVSAITLGELRLGVLSAGGSNQPEIASRRLATYQLARQFEPIPVDEEISDAWALLVAQLRSQGRKAPINDTWIAATAIVNDLPIITQDGDYTAMPGLTVVKL